MSREATEPSRGAALTVLAASGLAALAIALLQWTSGHPPRYVDDGVLAFRLVDGLGYSLAFHGPVGPTAAYSPLLPLLLAGIHLLLGDGGAAYAAVLFLQAAIHVATAWFVYAMARFWLPPWPAAVAGLLVGVHPSLLALSLDRGHLDERYGLAMMLMSLALLSLLRLFRDPAPPFSRLVTAGAAVGLAALADATVTLVAGIAFLALFGARHRARWGLRAPFVFALCAALVAAPWLVRNAAVFHTLVPMRSSGGLLFWVGNNPRASGTWSDQEIMSDPDRHATTRGIFELGGHATSFNFYARDTLPAALREELAQEDEVRRDRSLLGVALRWIAANPVRFLKLTARRAFYLAAGPPDGYDRRWPRVIYLATFLCAVAFVASRRHPGLGWAGAFLGVWWFVFSVTHCGYLDYRLVAEPFVLLSCAVGVYGVVQGRSEPA